MHCSRYNNDKYDGHCTNSYQLMWSPRILRIDEYPMNLLKLQINYWAVHSEEFDKF